MNQPLPIGTRVRISDVANFYWGEHGFIDDLLDGRQLGGKLAYTVRIPRDQSIVSLAANEDQIEVVTDAEMAAIRKLAAERKAAAESLDAEFGLADAIERGAGPHGLAPGDER